jgi:hypothetical protein
MKFVTDPEQLTIVLEGFEKLWALKSKLVIPRSEMAEVNFTPETPVVQDFSGYLRAPGTAVPWRFLAGTYRRRGDREFWYIHTQQPGLLTIELKNGPLKYERIRISCDANNGQSVIDWWRHGDSA